MKGGMPMSHLLSVKEAAKELAVSPHTVRAWTSQRRIPFIKLGRRVLFEMADLEKVIKTGRVEARHSRA